MVNALSTETIIEVARDKKLYRQAFSKGVATSPLEEVGAAPNRRGTSVSFVPDTEIFGADARFDPARIYKLARSKAYLFAGVEIRWRCDLHWLRPRCQNRPSSNSPTVLPTTSPNKSALANA